MCFVFHGDEILFMQENGNKGWNGTLDPLGGHVEKGESIVESADREILEESGIKVKNTILKGIIHVSNFFSKNVILFVTSSETDTKDIVPSEEGVPVWVHKDKLDTIKVFEDVKPILKHLLRVKSHEIFVGTSEFDGKDKLLSLDIRLN